MINNNTVAIIDSLDPNEEKNKGKEKNFIFDSVFDKNATQVKIIFFKKG